MKTTVRATVIIPDNYIRIQRLYDSGTFFELTEEVKTGHDAADFVEMMLQQGGKLIRVNHFIDDDDLTEKIGAHFEYISE